MAVIKLLTLSLTPALVVAACISSPTQQCLQKMDAWKLQMEHQYFQQLWFRLFGALVWMAQDRTCNCTPVWCEARSGLTKDWVKAYIQLFLEAELCSTRVCLIAFFFSSASGPRTVGLIQAGVIWSDDHHFGILLPGRDPMEVLPLFDWLMLRAVPVYYCVWTLPKKQWDHAKWSSSLCHFGATKVQLPVIIQFLALVTRRKAGRRRRRQKKLSQHKRQFSGAKCRVAAALGLLLLDQIYLLKLPANWKRDFSTPSFHHGSSRHEEVEVSAKGGSTRFLFHLWNTKAHFLFRELCVSWKLDRQLH